MKFHPDLMDPNAVLVLQSPRLERPAWEEFRLAGWRAMQALRIELDGERAVLKPNVTSGEHIADPDSGVTTHPGFVQGMVEYLQQHGARRSGITIAEDPRNSDDNTPRHWRATGAPPAMSRWPPRPGQSCIAQPPIHRCARRFRSRWPCPA